MTSKLDFKLFRDGKVHWEEAPEASIPIVEDGDNSGLADFSNTKVPVAVACIYCGSRDQLSNEHIIPFALGGKPQIVDGSCELCRKKTHKFETAVLRGPMRMVRFIQGLPSRTRHKDVPQTIPISITKNGQESIVNVPTNEAPILLPFPMFNEPKYLNPERGQGLELVGTVTGSYGADPEAFLKARGEKELYLTIEGNAPVAFAQMLAKIAYCFAWAHGNLENIESPTELAKTLLDEPNNIGRFVGALPEPHKRFIGVGHRLATKIHIAGRIMYVEVQLFAASGSPTYLVVLGKLKPTYQMQTEQ